MVVIKYNAMASYTKILARVFKQVSTRHYSDVNANRRGGGGNKRAESAETYTAHKLSEIKDIPSYHSADELFYIAPFLSVSDEFTDSPMETIHGYMKGIKYTVICPIVPYEERLHAIIHRGSLGNYPPIKYAEDAMVNGIKHYISQDPLRSKKVEKCQTVEETIMMPEFEDLVARHNKGELNLVILTKDTILNDTGAILNHLGISHDMDFSYLLSKIPRQGEENAHRTKVYAQTISKYKDILDKRYEEIYKLIEDNKIHVC